jgi:hypothetical protein
LKTDISLSGDHLRGSVTRRPASSLESLTVFIGITKPKIDNFDAFVMVQEEIFWFEISMDDVESMDILNPCDDLLEELAGLFFFNSIVRNDVFEEFTATGILHDQIELAGGLDDFVELDDVGVADQFQDMNFSGNPFDIVNICYLFFLENLYGNLEGSIMCKGGGTFSPVRMCVPNLTLPNVPSPIVFPREVRRAER